MTVRLLFASFPLWSLGLLAWVPSLRFAVLRRRPLDWAVFGLSVALTIGYVVLLFAVPAEPAEGEDLPAVLAGLYILALLVGATVHAILGDRFPRPPRFASYAPSGAPHGYGYPPSAGPVPTPASPPGHPAPPPEHPAPPPEHPAAPPSSHRMRQVASELDELDELLRKRGNDR